jgi:hypothetical protein
MAANGFHLCSILEGRLTRMDSNEPRMAWRSLKDVDGKTFTKSKTGGIQ